jgi:hypothetical protein
MLIRAACQSVLFSLVLVSIVSAAHGLTVEEVRVKLERAGYSQVQELKSGKITTYTAVRNGKVVSLIVDSSGHFKEFP